MTPEFIQQTFDELKAENDALRSALEAQQAQTRIFTIINEKLTDIVTLTDREGKILFAGKSIERLGYDPASVPGKNVMDFVHPEDLHHIMDAYGELTGSGSPGRVECRCLCEDGTYLWLETRGTFFNEENSNEPKILLISRDIAERKQAEKNLMESVGHFRAIIAHSPLLISVFDTDGRCLLVNPSISRLLKLPPSQLIGKAFSEVLSPEASNIFMNRIADVKKARGSISVEDSLNFDDGMRHFITTLFPLDDETGKIRSVGAIAHDITNRRKIEKALRESDEKYRSLFDYSVESLYLHDCEGRIVDVNEKSCLQSGYSKEELLKLTVFDFHPVQANMKSLPKNKILRQWRQWQPGQRYTLEAEHQRKDGTIYPVEITTGIIHYGGKKLIQAIVKDITSRKLSEQQTEIRLRLISYASRHSLSELMAKALGEVEQLLNSAISFLHFVEPDQKTLTLQQWSAATVEKFCKATGHGMHYSIDQAGVWADCVRERKGLIHNDYASLPNKKGMPEGHAGVVREMVVPVMRQNVIVAIMGVGNKPLDYTQEDLKILSFLADVTWEVISNKQTEESLSASEEKHRCLFETMSQGVVYQKADGEIISANPAAERILGLSFGQMSGMTSMDPRWKMIAENGSEIPGTDHPAMIALRTGQEIGPVIRGVFHPDKKDYIWLSVTAIPLFHPGDTKPFQVYATFEDITRRNRTEKALQESEKRLNLAMMIKNEGIWDWNLVSNETVFDDRYYTMAGYAPDEFPQKFAAWAERVHPDDLPEVEAAIKNYLSGHPERFNVEFRFRHRDGSWIWIRGQGQIVEQDENGTPLRMIGTHTDITKRKEAENKLRMAHEKLLTILDSIDSSVYVADMATYEILFMNQHMIDEFGGDKTGDVCFRVFRNNSEICSCCTNDQLIDRNERPAGVCTWHDQNPITGKHYINHDRAIEWIDGRLVRLQIATDITDLKKMEAQLLQARKMESVGRLAGGVAHDFNNMLTIINGYAEMMADLLTPSDPMYKSVKAILDAGKRSAVIVRKLLAFARKQNITPVPMNLNDVVAGMLKMLQRLIGENIDLSWKPGNNIWLIKMDYGQVDQILVNLVVNARDAIADVGKITIETQNIEFNDAYCAVHADFTPGQYVMLAVNDNGCGMDQHVLENLFEPFFTTKEVGQGTGLGLPTVYGIIKQNEGFVNVDSEVGKGTSVKMYIPRLLENPEAEGREKKAVPLLKGRGETILVLEDDATVLDITRIMLENLGYTVLAANTPNNAMALTEAHGGGIDLLITDIVMPEMNGRVFADQIKTVYPDIRVLFMSGYTADVIARHTILEEGMNYVEKPFSIHKLAEKVSGLLSAI